MLRHLQRLWGGKQGFILLTVFLIMSNSNKQTSRGPGSNSLQSVALHATDDDELQIANILGLLKYRCILGFFP